MGKQTIVKNYAALPATQYLPPAVFQRLRTLRATADTRRTCSDSLLPSAPTARLAIAQRAISLWHSCEPSINKCRHTDMNAYCLKSFQRSSCTDSLLCCNPHCRYARADIVCDNGIVDWSGFTLLEIATATGNATLGHRYMEALAYFRTGKKGQIIP